MFHDANLSSGTAENRAVCLGLNLESYCPADCRSNPNPNQTQANQGVQGYLIITDRCAGAGLELKSAALQAQGQRALLQSKAPFTPPAMFSLYVARLCTVKTLVGVPTAVALMLFRVFPALKILWRPPERIFVPPKPYLIGSCDL